MDFFQKAISVRLISHRDRFLIADEDCITISHGNDRSAKNAVWKVELIEGKYSIRLRSCYGTYLTASGTPIIPGVTGKRVVQTWPCQCDSATEWEPSRDGMQVRLRSIYGQFLRPVGGLTLWRNAIMHDVPHRIKTSEKMLWDVEVVEKLSSSERRPASASPFLRSRSLSSSMDLAKRNDDVRRLIREERDDEGFYNNDKYCWWYPKSCLPF